MIFHVFLSAFAFCVLPPLLSTAVPRLCLRYIILPPFCEYSFIITAIMYIMNMFIIQDGIKGHNLACQFLFFFSLHDAFF